MECGAQAVAAVLGVCSVYPIAARLGKGGMMGVGDLAPPSSSSSSSMLSCRIMCRVCIVLIVSASEKGAMRVLCACERAACMAVAAAAAARRGEAATGPGPSTLAADMGTACCTATSGEYWVSGRCPEGCFGAAKWQGVRLGDDVWGGRWLILQEHGRSFLGVVAEHSCCQVVLQT